MCTVCVCVLGGIKILKITVLQPLNGFFSLIITKDVNVVRFSSGEDLFVSILFILYSITVSICLDHLGEVWKRKNFEDRVPFISVS